MNRTCACGKGAASAYDGLCRYCRERIFSRAECKKAGVRHRGDGLSIGQAWEIWNRKHPPMIQFNGDKQNSFKVICDYCGKEAKLVPGSDIYFNRPDLAQNMYWECLPCEAHVGCHKNSPTHKPLGGLANKELRKKRGEAHAAFDPIWKHHHMSRNHAYMWLSSKLGIPMKLCHIGMFNSGQCDLVIALANGVLHSGS